MGKHTRGKSLDTSLIRSEAIPGLLLPQLVNQPVQEVTKGKRSLCVNGARDWNDASTVQSIPRIANNQQALRRVNEGFFPRALVSVL